jgi:hypothetical protein
MTNTCQKLITGLTSGKGANKKRHDKLLSNPMKHLEYIAQPEWDKHIEYMKSKGGCKAEHVFVLLKISPGTGRRYTGD